MSSNLDSDITVTTNKMYPIDLAPQKITIVKSMPNQEVKMAHLLSGPAKTTGSNQVMSHSSPGSGLMRSGLAQIISPNVASQPQMIVTGSPILQGTQIVSQGSQLIGQNTQIISQSPLITPSGQILSPGTQIISQGSQLSVTASVSCNNSIQTSISSSGSGTQMLNVSGQLMSGTGNLVVSSSVRTLPSTVRVLPPLPIHNTRPVQLSSVNVTNASGVLVNKSMGVGVTSHVPRGLAAGASLAVRPVTPAATIQPAGTQSSAWSTAGRSPRGALVYGSRSSGGRPAPPLSPANSTPSTTTQPAILNLPTTSVLNSSGVISSSVRGSSPRALTPTPTGPSRPLALLQRNYQPPKVVGVASVGVRGVVGNSAPTQLYYEVPRASTPLPSHPSITSNLSGPTITAGQTHQTVQTHQTSQTHQTGPTHQIGPTHQSGPTHSSNQTLSASLSLSPLAHRPLTPYGHQSLSHPQPQVSMVNAVSIQESRPPTSTLVPVMPRPTILRKRDIEGSPTKPAGGQPRSYCVEGTGWDDVPTGAVPPGGGSGGSTTISASSSPARDDELDPPTHIHPDLSPRKKPRKQILTNEVRQCDQQTEEPPPTPPPITVKYPKRPLLRSGFSCSWRSTALHFARWGDVRVREPRALDLAAIAARKHVKASAEGWKVHHLTAQMDDLVQLESDVSSQLAGVLRALEAASPRALSVLQPHSHALLELLKGNIQRSKIVCEGVQEAREDILRVFTHRNFVSEILTRQADKRTFRKHRSQS